MDSMTTFARDTLKSGMLATAATTLAVNALGKLDDGNAIRPLNAVSHILWGDRAARQKDTSIEYTLTGGLLNSMAVTGWAAVHRLLFGRGYRSPTLPVALAQGCATSALAYVTDYYVVPKRFTPGFEKRLSNGSLMAIYGTLALALAAGSLYCSRE